MLLARGPLRFDDKCGTLSKDAQTNGSTSGSAVISAIAAAAQTVHHQAKQDTLTRALRCEHVAKDITCTVKRMNRVAATAIARMASAHGLRGRRKQRREGRLTLPTGQIRRVREGRAVQNTTVSVIELRPRKPPTLDVEALVTGQCTSAEHRLCALALDRVMLSNNGSAAAIRGESVELCVLRRDERGP